MTCTTGVQKEMLAFYIGPVPVVTICSCLTVPAFVRNISLFIKYFAKKEKLEGCLSFC